MPTWVNSMIPIPTKYIFYHCCLLMPAEIRLFYNHKDLSSGFCVEETDIFVSNNLLKWHLIAVCNHCERMLVSAYLNITASACDVQTFVPTGATAMSERNPAVIARQGLAVPVRWKSEERAKQWEVRGESVRSTHTWLQLISSAYARRVILHFLQ